MEGGRRHGGRRGWIWGGGLWGANVGHTIMEGAVQRERGEETVVVVTLCCVRVSPRLE